MRTALSILLLAFAVPSSAATITATPNHSIVSVGDEIVVTYVFDPQGGTDRSVSALVAWNSSLVDSISLDQQPFTTNGVPWLVDPRDVLLDGDVYILDQSGPGAPDGPATTVLKLLATNPGDLVICAYGCTPADTYFDGAGVPSVSITILPAPEPASASLLALGIFLLAARRQHRRVVVA